MKIHKKIYYVLLFMLLSIVAYPAGELSLAVENNQTTVTLTWSEADPELFSMYRCGYMSADGEINEIVQEPEFIDLFTTTVDIELPDYGTYTFWVEALDETMEPYSMSVDVVYEVLDDGNTGIEETAELGLDVENVLTSVTLTWTEAEAENFSMYRCSYTDIDGILVDTLFSENSDPNITIAQVEVPSLGVYTFRIDALDSDGVPYASSPEITFDVLDNVAPAVPKLVNVEVDDTVTVTWSDITLISEDFSHYNTYMGIRFKNKENAWEYVMDDYKSEYIENSDLFPSEALGYEFIVGVSSVDVYGNESDLLYVPVTPLRHEREGNGTFIQADTLLTMEELVEFESNSIVNGIFGSLKGGAVAELWYGDVDVFAIYCPANRGIRIKTASNTYADNPLPKVNLELYDDNRQLVEKAYASEATDFELLEYISETDAYYFVRVFPYDDNHQGEYTIQYELIREDFFEPNNLIAQRTAEEKIADTLTPATIFSAYEIDLYEISGKAGEVLAPVFLSEIDLQVKLLDLDSNILRENSISKDELSEFLYPVTTDSKYILQITAGTENVSDIGTYFIGKYTIPKTEIDPALLITEFSQGSEYSPAYVEIFNNTEETIDLSEFYLYPYPQQTLEGEYLIEPHSYFTVSDNASLYSATYGRNPDIEVGSAMLFSVFSEYIIFNSYDQTVTFINTGSIVSGTEDTEGSVSYELKDLSLPQQSPDSWQVSYIDEGTPGEENSQASFYMADRFEPNNNFEYAEFVEEKLQQASLTDNRVSGAVDMIDWYAFPVAKGASYIIEATQNDTLKLKAYTYSDAFSVIDTLQLIDDYVMQSDYTADSAGYVYLKVENLMGEGLYSVNVYEIEEPLISSDWTETLNDKSISHTPCRWITYDQDENNSTWWLADSVGVNGSVAFKNGNNPEGNDDWLFLPPMSLGKHDLFSFMAKSDHIAGEKTNLIEQFEIWVGNADAQTVNDFELLAADSVVSHLFSKYEYSLKEFAGNNQKIAIRSTSVNKACLYLDNFALTKAPATGSFLVQTFGDDESTVIAGANIKIDSDLYVTNDEGVFLAEEILTGTYSITISAEGYEPQQRNVLVVDSEVSELNVVLLELGLQKDLPSPENISVSQYSGECNSLSWNVPEANNVAMYNVFRRETRGGWMLIATVEGSEFTDCLIDNPATEYIYAVTAVYPYGESAVSEWVSAIAKTPLTYIISETENYHTDFSADSLNAEWMTVKKDAGFVKSSIEDGSCVLYNSYSYSDLIGTEAVLFSPVFSFEESEMQNIVDFEYTAEGYGISILFVAEKNLSGQFDTISPLPVNEGKLHIRYDATSLTRGESSVRFALIISPQSGKLSQKVFELLLSDFAVAMKNAAIVSGICTYPSGRAAEGFTVTEVFTGKQTTTDEEGRFIFPASSFMNSDSVSIIASKQSELIEVVSDTYYLSEGNSLFVELQAIPVLPQVDSLSAYYNVQDTSLVLSWQDMAAVQSLSGSEFLGTYSVYHGNDPDDLELIEAGVSANTYVAKHGIGESGIYYIAADYDDGESPFSKGYYYEYSSTAEMMLDNDMLKIDIPYSVTDTAVSIKVFNTGTGVLDFSADYLVAKTTLASDTVAESGISKAKVYSLSPMPAAGDTAEINIFFENPNTSGEGISEFKIIFPEDAEIISASDISISNSVHILTGSVDEENNSVTWNSATAGQFQSNDRGNARVKIAIPSTASNKMVFNYTVLGDKSGEGVHYIAKQFAINSVPFDVSFTPQNHTVAAGDSSMLEILMQVNTRADSVINGQLHFSSNDANTPEYSLPLEITLHTPKYSISGELINNETGGPVAGALITAAGQETVSSEDGSYTLAGLAGGTYTLTVSHDYYFSTDLSFELLHNLKMDAVILEPNLPQLALDDIVYADEKITLEWEQDETGLELQSQFIIRSSEAGKDTFLLAVSDTLFVDSLISAGTVYSYSILTDFGIGIVTSEFPSSVQMPNTAPVITMTDSIRSDEDVSVSVKLTVTDTDQQELQLLQIHYSEHYSLEFRGDTALTVIPAADWSGTDSIAVAVTDGIDADTAFAVLIVSEINDAPVLGEELPDFVEFGEDFSFVVTYVDESESVNILVSGLPEYLEYDSASATISGTIPDTLEAPVAFNITLDDGMHQTSITATMEGTGSTAPVVVSTPVTVAVIGGYYEYTLSAESMNGEGLQYSAVSLPNWLTFNEADHSISGTPDMNSLGANTVIVAVADEYGKTVNQEFQIQVKAENNPPIFNTVNNKELYIDKPFVFAVSATDYNLDSLSFSVVEKPEWMDISQEGDNYIKVSGTPAEGSEGEHLVIFSVTDNLSESISLPFYVYVSAYTAIENREVAMQVYPNPVAEQLFIETESTIDAVEVVAADGCSVYQSKIGKSKAEINLSQLLQGVYWVKLMMDDRIVIEKIVKE